MVYIVYDGDIDGDSDTVNNRADVLSIYAVRTMCDGQEVLTITPEKVDVLRDTFNEMNRVSSRMSFGSSTVMVFGRCICLGAYIKCCLFVLHRIFGYNYITAQLARYLIEFYTFGPVDCRLFDSARFQQQVWPFFAYHN